MSASEHKIAVPWHKNRDFLAGLMLIIVGLGAIIIARDYPVGSTLRMGPGYFPIALGGLLFLFGIYVMVLGLIKKEPVEGSWSLRALVLLPLATAVFGYLIEHVGFVPALIALIFISAAAGDEFKFKEVLVLSVVLTALSVALFIYGLEMPYPLLKGFN